MCKEFPGFVCAVSNKDDFAQELTEYGFDYVAGDKPVVAARDAKGLKYKMEVIIKPLEDHDGVYSGSAAVSSVLHPI